MATNKFATTLHSGNTHRLAVVLIYAVLEWILITLLLFNSLFTFLITKFAKYFGLKPPCPWCSRIDHVWEHGANTINSRSDLICETHAADISKLSYCSNHQKLAESRNMCINCLASTRTEHSNESGCTVRRIACISWIDNRNAGNFEEILKCSCCDERLSSDINPPCLLFKHSWDSFRCTEKGSFIVEAIDDIADIDGIDDCKEVVSKNDCLVHVDEDKQPISNDCFFHYCEERYENRRDGEEEQRDKGGAAAHEHQVLSEIESSGIKDAADEALLSPEPEFSSDEREGNVIHQQTDFKNMTEKLLNGMEIRHDAVDSVTRSSPEEDKSLENIILCMNRDVDGGIGRMIPIELIDLSTIEHGRLRNIREEPGKEVLCDGAAESNNGSQRRVNIIEEEAAVKLDKNEEKRSALGREEMKINGVDEESKEDTSPRADQILVPAEKVHEVIDVKETYNPPAVKSEATTDSSQESTSSLMCLLQQNRPSANMGADETTPNGVEISITCNGHEPNNSENKGIEERVISPKKSQEGTNHQLLSMPSETSSEALDEKIPETPTSLDGDLHNLNKKILLFEKRESGGAEESSDGSERDPGDPILTMERLKTELNTERKALRELYAELEEERSASAIAANQTMAMINRLQEEKAAMQMEALQYQRMMEEQSEYDQEALQLLNELMIKKEKEKQELEKELEALRKKVVEYEAKEKMRIIRRTKDGSVTSRNSSDTYSNNGDDIDVLSINLNAEARDEDSSISGNQEKVNKKIPDDDENVNLEEIALDCVKQLSALDGSLAEFEEERLSILDQLKALEEKLLTLSDNEFIEDIDLVGCSSNYIAEGSADTNELGTPEGKDTSELSEGKHRHQRITMSAMAKNLLPLLDAVGNETDDEEQERVGLSHKGIPESEFVEMEDSSVPIFELDNKRVAIGEEVDHVYERLQALEADREFLEHCMGSIRNGDKGMDLLQEILQHLRDLKAVELPQRKEHER